jgi:hypothetical protein
MIFGPNKDEMTGAGKDYVIYLLPNTVIPSRETSRDIIET